jgi:hypothetical protein
MTIFDAVSMSLLAYLAAGALFSIWFFAKLASRLDPDVRGASRVFYFVAWPGVVTLWPLLLRASLRSSAPRERNAHEDAARCGGQR